MFISILKLILMTGVYADVVMLVREILTSKIPMNS